MSRVISSRGQLLRFAQRRQTSKTKGKEEERSWLRSGRGWSVNGHGIIDVNQIVKRGIGTAVRAAKNGEDAGVVSGTKICRKVHIKQLNQSTGVTRSEVSWGVVGER